MPTTTPISQQLETLTAFERWREANATGTPDVSIEAYGKWLRADRYGKLLDQIVDMTNTALDERGDENVWRDALTNIKQTIWEETA